MQLNKAEKKPPVTRLDDGENLKMAELFNRMRSILTELTPQNFQARMKQVMELDIRTEESLNGVVDLIFEKAIAESNFVVAYANMCRCLIGLKVPTTDKPGVTVNFRKLLLKRCKEEMEAAKPLEQTNARDQAHHRSLGNLKFIGELFKLKMLTQGVMHDIVVKLLKSHNEESMECLCVLLTTIGKDLDSEKSKPRMDQYFNQMHKIIKEKKTSSRIRCMLQDVVDLRRNSWVPRRDPEPINQIHEDAELEQHGEQITVQQQKNKKDGGGGMGGHGSHNQSSWVPRRVDDQIHKDTELEELDEQISQHVFNKKDEGAGGGTCIVYRAQQYRPTVLPPVYSPSGTATLHSVASAQLIPCMINPAHQQQQAPPPQQPPAQPQGPPKRKQFRIRDPNQGGRDITAEIMSGGRSTTTPTPPQQQAPPAQQSPAQIQHPPKRE